MTSPLRSDDPSRCMKCGFCMSVCPVYQEDLLEGHVARGRNMLIKCVEDGHMDPSDAYREELSYCLLCKRCSNVCPAKLTPHEITLNAKSQIVERLGLTRLQQWVNHALLNHRSSLAQMMGLAALLPITASNGKIPLRHLADSVGIFSRSVSLPLLSSPPLRKRVNSLTHPPDKQPVKGKVAVFPGCIFEFFQARIGEDMVNALAKAGYEVAYKADLCCCGQAVHSSGDYKTARMMAQKNIDALDSFDTIITGCATCSSAMKAYGRWFEKDDQWWNRAVMFSEKIRDFSEFLADQDEQPGNKTDQITKTLTVTYHDPCHLRQHQGVFEAPRKILRALPGVRFIEMENADACCGLGGSFGISHRDIAFAIQEKKIKSIKKTGAEAVVTSCPGCLMFLSHGVHRYKLPIKVMHIAELVADLSNTSKDY